MTHGRPLRVAIDLTQVDNQSLGSGQYRYSVDLVNALCGLDEPLHVTVLGSRGAPVPEIAAALAAANTRGAYVAMAAHAGRGAFYLDVARVTAWLARHRMDVYHQVHTIVPPIKTCGVVATLYHYYPDETLFATRPYRYYRWALRERVDVAITISDATRDDMHRHFGVPLERMHTVYPGLSTTFSERTPSPARAHAAPFILSPYNLSTPKNLRALIDAWPAIARHHPSLQLVLYGRAQITYDGEVAFDDHVASLAHGDRIRRIGQVSDAELAALYEECTLFVFPTLVEGFGYPLLEAMAHGACCIARDASAMKEIGGDAVCLVETREPAAIAEAALELLADERGRDALRARARTRASAFTVQRMARETLACYRAAAERPRA